MFTKRALAFLSINLLLCSFIIASDMQDDEATRSKCKKFNSLTVCNSVTANSFVTPSGPLFNGLRNWAVFTNQAEVLDGANILWAATPAANISSGITFDNTTGAITLPTSGIFLVQYSVNFGKTASDITDVGIAQLQQTVAGAPTNVSQATINSAFVTDPGETLAISEEITGYALITTTSTLNNVINLQITLTANMELGTATGSDANAQMIILQLN